MGFGASLVLMAVGAILMWAVEIDVKGLDLYTVGLILLVIGIVGFALSLIFWSSWGGWRPGRRETVEDRTVYTNRY